MEEKSFYTVKEAADLAGLVSCSIRAAITSGRLEATKINGGYIIAKEELERFIKARATK